MKVLTCREALLLVLDQVDYTKGACSLISMVGAALPAEVIDRAREAIAAESVPLMGARTVEAEREQLRAAQAAAVMPLIGPLLDAWEGLAGGVLHALEIERPSLFACLQDINAAMENPPPVESLQVGHPEARCEECGGPNFTWFAPNSIWNAVMKGREGIICASCFVAKAEAAGFNKDAWRLEPEFYSLTEGRLK